MGKLTVSGRSVFSVRARFARQVSPAPGNNGRRVPALDVAGHDSSRRQA